MFDILWTFKSSPLYRTDRTSSTQLKSKIDKCLIDNGPLSSSSLQIYLLGLVYTYK